MHINCSKLFQMTNIDTTLLPSGANTASVNCFNGVVMSIKSSTTRSTKAPWILSLSSSNFCDNNLKKKRLLLKNFKNQSRQKCHTWQLLGLEANCPVQSGTNLRVDEIASQLDYIAQEFLHVVHLEVLGQPESILSLSTNTSDLKARLDYLSSFFDNQCDSLLS